MDELPREIVLRLGGKIAHQPVEDGVHQLRVGLGGLRDNDGIRGATNGTEGDGFGVLRASKESDPELPVIVMTAFGSIQDAVAAMKEGALDFLAKPVDPEHLLLMVERALAQRRLATEHLILREDDILAVID